MNGTTNVTPGDLTTDRTERSLRASSSMVEAIGGITTIVLAIIGLAGGFQNDMLSIAIIVLGASLILEGGAIATSFRRAMFSLEGTEGGAELGGAATTEFLAGFTGIVLGILALLGVGGPSALNHLVSSAVIVFGASLLLSSSAVSHLHSFWSTSQYNAEGSRFLAQSACETKAAGQMLVGLAAVVLGIIALVSYNAAMLNLVALLALGVAVLLSGTAFGARAMLHKRV